MKAFSRVLFAISFALVYFAKGWKKLWAGTPNLFKGGWLALAVELVVYWNNLAKSGSPAPFWEGADVAVWWKLPCPERLTELIASVETCGAKAALSYSTVKDWANLSILSSSSIYWVALSCRLFALSRLLSHFLRCSVIGLVSGGVVEWGSPRLPRICNPAASYSSVGVLAPRPIYSGLKIDRSSLCTGLGLIWPRWEFSA